MTKAHLFRGYKIRNSALLAAREATTSPDAMELHDGSWAGLGDRILRSDTNNDRMLFGQHGGRLWLSDYNGWRDAVLSRLRD